MPKPRTGETEQDFLERCVPDVIGEGASGDQAVAICLAYYEGEKDEFKDCGCGCGDCNEEKAYNVPDEDIIQYYKAFDNRRNSFQRKYATKTYQALLKQLKPVLEANSVQDMRTTLSSLPVEELYKELYTDVGDTFARLSYENLKGYKYLTTKAIPSWIQQMINYALKSRRIKDVTQNTQDEVSNEIVKALEKGLGEQDTMKEIVANTLITSQLRAERIARTEIISASNAGSLEGARASGLKLNKKWITTPDDRTRESHKAENIGQAIVPLEEKFFIDGEYLDYPGDVNGSAKNVINCRCTQVYINI
jgi:virulence-associated protein VapD